MGLSKIVLIEEVNVQLRDSRKKQSKVCPYLNEKLLLQSLFASDMMLVLVF